MADSSETNEDARLRRAYARLPKTEHGDEAARGHGIHPEWVMLIIEDPHLQRREVDERGRLADVSIGRVAGVSQWVKVVLNLEGELVTAFPDRRLAQELGGPPWPRSR